MMSIGSILVGTAALLAVAAYVARPLRTCGTSATDRAIEAWVAQVRDDVEEAGTPSARDMSAVSADGSERVVNFCPQCGQRTEAGDRFCSGCGTPLRRSS